MRIRQHVNPNQLHFARFRGERPALDGRAVELEIGCADAQFLFERAARDASRQYVGLEIREDLVRWVNQRSRALAVPVHAVFCQAQLHLREIFPPGTVDRVYINFPDPWFKRRHHDRRMVDDVLAAGIATVARPGADVFVQSDVWAIALDAMATFERDERFTNLAGEWGFWRGGNPYGVRSWREQNAEETGLPIWRIRYRVRASAEACAAARVAARPDEAGTEAAPGNESRELDAAGVTAEAGVADAARGGCEAPGPSKPQSQAGTRRG